MGAVTRKVTSSKARMIKPMTIRKFIGKKITLLREITTEKERILQVILNKLIHQQHDHCCWAKPYDYVDNNRRETMPPSILYAWITRNRLL
jgi:hypothetical protein